MKINHDLIRDLLLEIEDKYDGRGIEGSKLHLPQYSETEISYHANLLYNKNYILSYSSLSAGKRTYFSVGGLTIDGEEYLNSIRDTSKWYKIKTKTKEHGLDLTFEAIKYCIGLL